MAAHDALGRPLTAAIGDCGDGTFLVEAAEAVGLGLLKPRERDPRQTGSAGLAELLHAALALGATRILVGLGGSATVDGGLGMLAGLGAAGSGRHRRGAARRARHRPRAGARLFAGVELSVLHDVDVPLCGPDGAAALFGPQKGLRRADVEPFDLALERLGEAFGGDIAQRPGAGAAGGLGAALYALGGGLALGLRCRDRARRAARPARRRGALPHGRGLGRPPERARQDGRRGARRVPRCRCPLHRPRRQGQRRVDRAPGALGALDVRAIGPPGRRLDVALAAAADELAAAAQRAVAGCDVRAGAAADL